MTGPDPRRDRGRANAFVVASRHRC